MSIKRITNSNTIPLVDELVYYSKIICRDLEVKDMDLSGKYETLDSIKSSDLYIKCMEDKATISNFTYTKSELVSYGLDLSTISGYLLDPTTIPSIKQKEILKVRMVNYIDSYDELNNYYRSLYGLPDYGNIGIYITSNMVDTSIYDIDVSIPIHEMNTDTQDVLLALGIVDTLLQTNSTALYLKHIGSNKISIYKARKAIDFQLLFLPSDVPSEISKRFESQYEDNRKYIMRRVYSEAFKYQSDNYNAFISIFIIISTLSDIFCKLSDFFIKGDIFDLGTIELIFKSNGIKYFPDIPKKYQKAMVRNLNRLIKYKASYQSIVDISSLFGFDNVEVFKYYILKKRLKDNDGNFVFNEDDNDNYELKFLKVPIDDIPDNYIHNTNDYLDYEDITDQDEYWDGTIDHNYVEKKIIEYEFNILRTQYLSIDTAYSMSELSFQSTYFYNMFFDDVLLENQLVVKVPTISTVASLKISELLIYLFALGYNYIGLSDNILYKPSEVLTIAGFNFEANLTTLSNYMANKGYTLADLGVDNFQIPTSSVLTTKQLMYIFNENTKVYNHICYEMRTADNKDIYDIYKYLYDALLVTQDNMDYYKKSDGTLASGYTDYLKDKNTILYKSIEDITSIEDDDERTSKISNMISDVVYILEELLGTSTYKYIWDRIPAVSSESIKHYLYEVINFFKSYKTTILNIDTIYN